MLQSVRVSPATSQHLRTPPIYLYTCFLLLVFFVYRAMVIYTGECSFPLPSSIVFTSGYPLNLLPPHPSPVLSIFPALCVLLRSSNFLFDFGGNVFFTNQRGSQPPHTHPPTPPFLLLSLLPMPSLLCLPFWPPLALQAREEIKEPPSFPC